MIRQTRSFLGGIKRSVESKIALSKLDNQDRELVEGIKNRKLTYLSDKKLASMIRTCRGIETDSIDGDSIEVGCALGGSSIVISTLKVPSRPFFVYDVFGMIPSPTQNDTADVHERYDVISGGRAKGIDGDEYYGYKENLYDTVLENLRSFGIEKEKDNVTLVKGLVDETLTVDRPVAFAHIDVDWFDPVTVCLERIFPWLSVGGSIILDDYMDWGGCRKAADQFLLQVPGEYTCDKSGGTLRIIRTKAAG